MSSSDALLNQPFLLTAEQVEFYRNHGHICLRGVFPADLMERWRERIREAAWAHAGAQAAKPLDEKNDYERQYVQVVNLWRKDERVAPFSQGKRLARLAADLMEVDAVRLYHDQAVFKEPGGSPTTWHQDQSFMPFDTPGIIGCWVALMPVPQSMGSMRFVSGSHRLGWLGKMPPTEEADELVQHIVRGSNGLHYSWYGAMETGDVTFHSAWTLHSAAGNPTPNTREVINLFYLDAAARIVAPMSPDHEIGLKYNVGGRAVGDLPDTPQNPVLFDRALERRQTPAAA